MYKAKKINDKSWIVGFYYETPEGNSYILRNLNTYDRHKVHSVYCEVMDIQIDKKTLCRDTGREDSSENIIWEGDRFKIESQSYETGMSIGIVEWSESHSAWCLVWTGGEVDWFGELGIFSELEKIGNVHD